MDFRLIDSHAHLDYHTFDEDRQSVIERATGNNLQCIINPGTDLHSSWEVVNLAETCKNIYAGVGVHPSDAVTWQSNTAGELVRLTVSKKVCAIGEIGLDYYRDHAPRPLQRKIFEKQLEIACQTRLPVIIHNREATEDMLNIIGNWIAGLKMTQSPLVNCPGVFHAFSASLDVAQWVIEHNFYIGITGVITYPNAYQLRQVVQSLPLKYLLIETDSPFLTPQPRRGKRNEPAYVSWVAEKIAELHGTSMNEVAQNTTNNAIALFKLGV